MPRGRPLAELRLTSGEREALERLVRLPTRARVLALRARIVLACASGASNTVVASSQGVTRQMVGRWRARFLARGLEGLRDEIRPGSSRRVADAEVVRVLSLTLETRPDAPRWSTRRMAAETGLSQSTISRIWRTFALRPRRTETASGGIDGRKRRSMPSPRSRASITSPVGD